MKRQKRHHRFKSNISKDPVTGCWNWKSTLNRLGYGVFVAGNRTKGTYFRKSAHRTAWMMRYGPVPEGKNLLHSCNNPACVNTDHLRIGTHKQNMEDRKAAGNYLQGSKHFNSKYTEELARSVYAAEGAEHAVARRFGVPRDWVNRVRSGRGWKHISGGIPSLTHNPLGRNTGLPSTEAVA